MRFGAIEAGGTKFVCGVGTRDGVIEEKISFPTTHPGETIEKVIRFFEGKDAKAIGVGSFGPIDLNPSSPTYGFVTATPKPHWSQFNFLGALKEKFDIPFGWDTDVNAAAYGEAKWGEAKGLNSCVYFTIGTGVGMGAVAEGQLVHGLVHPEGGHVLVRRHEQDDFQGNCPFHGDCLEGMAAGPAIEARWQVKGEQLAPDHPAWELEAHYISQAVINAIFMLSPQKVILGGGVMKQSQLFPLIRQKVSKGLNDYVKSELILNRIDDYIVAPGLGDDAGLKGALALGIDAI